jgi:hypothetical protein
MVEIACEGLPWIGERKSWPMLRRTVRAAERQARRLSAKRYAPPAGPQAVIMLIEEADGRWRQVYPVLADPAPDPPLPGEAGERAGVRAGA